MSSERRRREGGRARNALPTKLPQLAPQDVVNPYPPMDLLSADQLEAIHLASLRILEELGIEVTIKQRVAEIQFGPKSRQIYFLAEQTGGEFGTGSGEEFTASNHEDPEEGIYIPIWMPFNELLLHQNNHPADVATLVVKSIEAGWAESASFEDPEELPRETEYSGTIKP